MVIIDAKSASHVDESDVPQQVSLLCDDGLQARQQLGEDGHVVDGAAEVAMETNHAEATLRPKNAEDFVEVSAHHTKLGVFGNCGKRAVID